MSNDLTQQPEEPRDKVREGFAMADESRMDKALETLRTTQSPYKRKQAGQTDGESGLTEPVNPE